MPEPETRSREAIVRLNQAGREWLLSLFSALRTVQIHDPQNQIFNDPVAILTKRSEEIVNAEGRFDVRLVGDQFFLNGIWIKPTLFERGNLFLLADFLLEVGLGGVIIRSRTSDSDWRSFLGVYRAATGSKAERASEINRLLAAARVEPIEVTRILQLKEESAEDLPLPRVAYNAVTTYAKALLALQEFAAAQPGEEQVAVLRKAQRVICELIEFADHAPRLLCALTLIKNVEVYFLHHGVNVLILSFLLGRELGMHRKELVDLGMAALLHDVGKLRIPESVLGKETPLSEDERRRVERHPLESATSFLTLGYLNDAVAERVLVAYQHHWASRLPAAYPKPRRPMTPSLMAEIVAVAVRYDAITTDKLYREGLAPWQALRLMARENDQGAYRRDILDAFLALMGPLPIGSWVQVAEGKEGMVATSGSLSMSPPWPCLFIPAENGGGEWFDAARLTAAGGKVRLNARRTSIDVYRKTLAELFRCSEASPLL